MDCIHSRRCAYPAKHDVFVLESASLEFLLVRIFGGGTCSWYCHVGRHDCEPTRRPFDGAEEFEVITMPNQSDCNEPAMTQQLQSKVRWRGVVDPSRSTKSHAPRPSNI